MSESNHRAEKKKRTRGKQRCLTGKRNGGRKERKRSSGRE